MIQHLDYVTEYIWPKPRPAVAFGEDYAFNACSGHVVGQEVTGTDISHTRRFIFEPSEDITRSSTGRPVWSPRRRVYVPDRMIRFTDKVEDGPDSA